MYDSAKVTQLEGRGNYSKVVINGLEKNIYTKGTGDKKTILQLNEIPTVWNIFPSTSDENQLSFIRDQFNRGRGLLDQSEAEEEMHVTMSILQECLKNAPNLSLNNILDNFCIPISFLIDNSLSNIANSKLQESKAFFAHKSESLEKKKSERVCSISPAIYTYICPSFERMHTKSESKNSLGLSYINLDPEICKQIKTPKEMKKLGLLLSNYAIPDTGDFMWGDNSHLQNIYWVRNPEIYGCYAADLGDVLNVNSFENIEKYKEVLSEMFFRMWWCATVEIPAYTIFWNLDNLLCLYSGSLERLLPKKYEEIVAKITLFKEIAEIDIKEKGTPQKIIAKFKNAVSALVTQEYGDKIWAEKEKFSEIVKKRNSDIGLGNYYKAEQQKIINQMGTKTAKIYSTINRDLGFFYAHSNYNQKN